MPLVQLKPELLGGMFGRPGSLVQKSPWIRGKQPQTRFLMIGLIASLALLKLADMAGVLSNNGTPAAISLVVHAPTHLHTVGMTLLQDPVGLIVLIVTVGTPLFCAVQVEAIKQFVAMNERNQWPSPTPTFSASEVSRCATKANSRFAWIGSRRVSLVLLVMSAAGTAYLYYTLAHTGLMESWNPTNGSDVVWREQVYDGWWANFDRHPELAISLCTLAWYMFYFLSKQLLMGWVFTVFAKEAHLAGFGVTPNLEFDSDGYSGLRPLRRFMQWTYGSSLSHFIVTLGVFIVWLPLTPSTLFICIAIMITNAAVVIYPSTVAHKSAIAAKTGFVDCTYRDDALNSGEKQATIARVWATPNLPFRTRSTLTAATLYLFVPLLLAIVSTLLQR